MKSKLLLWIGVISSLLFYTTAVVFELEVFEGFCELMALFEAYELDEVVLPLLVLNFFLILYVIRIGRETSLDKKKSKIHMSRLQELSLSGEVIKTVLDNMEKLKIKASQDTTIDSDWTAQLDQHIKTVLISAKELTRLKEAEEREIQKIIKGV